MALSQNSTYITDALLNLTLPQSPRRNHHLSASDINMSRLEQLPQGIRRDIFRYLLRSDRVRQEPDHLLVEHYIFEVNILRASRGIKSDAMAVLYGENTFVKSE